MRPLRALSRFSTLSLLPLSIPLPPACLSDQPVILFFHTARAEQWVLMSELAFTPGTSVREVRTGRNCSCTVSKVGLVWQRYNSVSIPCHTILQKTWMVSCLNRQWCSESLAAAGMLFEVISGTQKHVWGPGHCVCTSELCSECMTPFSRATPCKGCAIFWRLLDN